MARANRPPALRMLLAGLICCCLSYLAAPALAADGVRLLKQGEEHYQFAEWDQARQALDQALAAGNLGPAQRARAYFHLGLVAEAQGDAVAAAARFRQAKAADPAWSPDPAQFPPSAVARFNQAGPASPATPAPLPPATPAAPAAPAPPLALPQPPPAPPALALTPAAPPGHAIREAELPPAAMPAPAPTVDPAMAPAAEPRFDQQDLIEQRRQARLTFVEGVDLFNAGRYAEAEQRFLAFLAVFPGDNQGEHFLALTRKTLAVQGSGNLRVTSRQPATVFLDGRPVGQTPLALDNLSVGRHQVEVRAGGNSQSQVVEIKGRTTTSIAFDLTRYEVPEAPAPAAAAPGAWRHPGLGFGIVPPPGWRVGDKPADADLRLVPDSGQGFIQVNSTPSDRQLDPATYAELWGRNYQQMVQPGAQRLASQARSLAGGAAWQCEFAGDDVRTVVVFISRPQRMYVLTGAWAAVDHERRLPDFNAAVESFQAP